MRAYSGEAEAVAGAVGTRPASSVEDLIRAVDAVAFAVLPPQRLTHGDLHPAGRDHTMTLVGTGRENTTPLMRSRSPVRMVIRSINQHVIDPNIWQQAPTRPYTAARAAAARPRARSRIVDGATPVSASTESGC
jgi:hypothetical protein